MKMKTFARFFVLFLAFAFLALTPAPALADTPFYDEIYTLERDEGLYPCLEIDCEPFWQLYEGDLVLFLDRPYCSWVFVATEYGKMGYLRTSSLVERSDLPPHEGCPAETVPPPDSIIND
jgi:hypothetical protein